MEASAIHAPAAVSRFPLAGSLLRLRSDEQLLAQFRIGNDEAFRVLHDRYRQRLFAYVRQMLSAGSRQDAEDVLQDVFVRAYGALRNDNRDMNVRAWLYRVAHNRCIDHLRRPIPPAAEVFEMSRKPLHDPVEEAQRRDDLRQLVHDVGEPARAAALGAADARDGRHDVRRPRRRAGRHGPRGQVAARARPDRARRGRRGARRRLRRDPCRPAALLRQGREGLRPRAQAHALVRRLPRVPRRPARHAALVRGAHARRPRSARLRGQADRLRRLRRRRGRRQRGRGRRLGGGGDRRRGGGDGLQGGRRRVHGGDRDRRRRRGQAPDPRPRARTARARARRPRSAPSRPP